MARRTNGADFPKSVAAVIAKRAAFKCTFPGCQNSTIGPGAGNDQIAATGSACHIFSARDGGPRGTGGLTFQERQHPDNGIWLCAIHAQRIDKNNGIEFPFALLKAYKRLHEEKLRREANEGRSAVGWIHSVRIDDAPIFRTPAEIQFGKVTVIEGGNGSGKTALLDWIHGISEPKVLERWADAKRNRVMSYEIEYLDPIHQRLRIRIRSPNEIEYFINGAPIPFHAHPVRFVRLKKIDTTDLRGRHVGMTDMDFLSKTLSLNHALVRNMLSHVGIHRGSTVSGLRIESNPEAENRVWTNVQDTIPGLDLQRSLSHSERARVLIEIAAVFARESAKYVPTVLLLDWAAKSFDYTRMGQMIDFLSNDENPFQTIIERVTGLGGHDDARLVVLDGTENDVMIKSFATES